jgi:hypothetical protein
MTDRASINEEMRRPNAEPVALLDAVDLDAHHLDQLSKIIDSCTAELEAAEEAWDELYDRVAESLKDDMDRAERKGDPAEHWITSTTRRQHRAEYQRLRRAKRNVEACQNILAAKRAALSGRQSELKALGDEAAAQRYVGQRVRDLKAA